jgi:hypothetical protein
MLDDGAKATGEVIEVLDLAQVVDRATADPTPPRPAASAEAVTQD